MRLQILANFGGSPYSSDLKNLEADAAQQIHAEVQATSVPSKGKVIALQAGILYLLVD